MTEKANDGLVERVVTSPKGFTLPDPTEGNHRNRRRAKKGERVRVPLTTAKAFKHALVDPKVLAAQQRALEAEQEEEEEEEEEEDTKSASTPSSGSGSGSGSGSQQAPKGGK